MTFPVANDGTVGTMPLPPIIDDRAITAWLYGIYIQDEWRPIGTDHDQLRRPLRSLRRHRARRPGQPAGGSGLQACSSTRRLHAAYARYFAPPPTELVTVEAVDQSSQDTTGAPPTPFTRQSVTRARRITSTSEHCRNCCRD